MRAVLVFAAIALPVCGQPTAQDILAQARAALGGDKLAGVQSLAVWGPDRRGASSTMQTLSIDLSGKFLKEQTSFSSGGQVQRTTVGEEGGTAVGGGMPGDDGGPALVAGVSEGLNADSYWSRSAAGETVRGDPAKKRSFRDAFARYSLAFTLSAPANFPVTFVYAGRLETPGGMADALQGVGPGDFGLRLFIDAKTHLPLMMNFPDNGHDVQVWLKEYKPEGGILFPHVITWVADGNLTEEFQAQKIKVNPKFRKDIFGHE